MPLTYGKSSPKNMLAKAQSDLTRLEFAEAEQDLDAMSDALFDLAVVVTSLKDWLKKHPSAMFSKATVEQYSAASTALSSFRDIANSGKHRVITKYVPRTSDVSTSAASSSLVFIENLTSDSRQLNSYPRLKIIRADGSRHRAVDLARAAIHDWQVFIQLIRPRGLARPSRRFPICSILVKPMNARIAPAILLVTFLFATWPTRRSFYRTLNVSPTLVTTSSSRRRFRAISRPWKALCGGCSHCHRSARTNASRHLFSPRP
jgi:hypothetical protein